MEAQNIIHFCKVEELLQYFSGANVVFAEADDSAALADIGAGLTEGEIVAISGSNQTDNNKEWTLGTIAAAKILLDGAVVADAAANNVKINQVVYTAWKDVSCMAKIVGSITSSGNCTVLVQQSQDGVNVDFATSIAVTGGTSKEIDVAVYLKYARLKITNGDADQTAFRAIMNGRTVS
jgi:hypothetical protein